MLKQRILTAIIIAPIAIAGVFFLPPFYFAGFIAAVLSVGAWEWANFAGYEGVLKYLYASAILALMIVSWFFPPALVLGAALLWWLVAAILVVSYPRFETNWASPLIISSIGMFVLVPGFVALMQLKESVDASFLILLLFFLIFCFNFYRFIKILWIN